jgi:hypothetical protein
MRSPCLILGLINIILLGILYWLHRSVKETYNISEPYNIRETYTNLGDNQHMRAQTATIDYLESSKNLSLSDTIQLMNYDPSILANDKTIYVKEKNTLARQEGDYTLNDIATDIMNESNAQIDWPNAYIDDSSSPILAVLSNENSSIDDVYGKKGVLSSDFKKDICKKYLSNNKKKHEYCQKLSAENCKLMDCCILLNGTKCIAGSMSGPVFLTEGGLTVDQNYFYFKDKCYGNCESADSFATACGNYTSNSTGVSKECMIKMFNNYGCPNPSPNALINDLMVSDYSKTTKQYVDNYIKTAVDVLNSTDTAESNALCNGTQ